MVGRPPISMIILSNSFADIKGPNNLPVRSMREEVGEVDFSVLLKVADGTSKGLTVIQCRESELSAQAVNSSKDIPVRVAVGCVVAGNVNPFPAVHGEQNDGERVNFPADGLTADLQCEGTARKCPFLFWHGGRMAGVGK